MSEALSLCMIVKDEERALPRCLDSVRNLAPEIIVVDTGSRDSTPAVAAAYGAQVVPFDFERVDFSAARNCGLARATGRWVMVLDADETLHPDALPLVSQLTAQNQNAGFYFERLNQHPNPRDSTTDYAIRLFPNRPDYRYRGRVHETVDAAILAAGGRLLRSGVRIDHAFAADAEARRRRNLWYIEILQEEIIANPEDYSRLDFLAAEYHQLGMYNKAAEIAERIATVRPLDPQAHLHAGLYHLLYKVDRAQARIDFEEALRLKPGYAEAQSFLDLLTSVKE